MNEVRKFRIIVDSKELCTCSGSSPSSVAKKAVKKLCEGSKKIVKFSLKECKRDCKKVYGSYQGHMKKLDKPYKQNGKLITHQVVCKKVQINKMRGGIDSNTDDLYIDDFVVIGDKPFRSEIHEKKVFFKKQWVFFDIISGISSNENNASKASTKNENNEQNNANNIPQFYQYVVIKDTSKNITFKKHEIISGNEDHSIEHIEITDIEISVLIELYINILKSIINKEQPTDFATTIRKTLEEHFIDNLNYDQLEVLYKNITVFCKSDNPICSEFLEKLRNNVSKRNRNQRKEIKNDNEFLFFQLSSDEIQNSNNFRIVFLEEENQHHIFFHTIELNGKQFYKYKVIIDSNNNITFREIFENEESISVKTINIGEIEYDALLILKEIQNEQDPIKKNEKFKELIDDMIKIWDSFEVTNNSNIKIKIEKVKGLFVDKNKYYIFFHNVSGYYQYVLIKHSDKTFTVKKMNVKKISSNEELRTFLDINIETIHSDILEKLHLDILGSSQFKQNSSFATTIRTELRKYTEGHKETELTFEDFKKEIHSNYRVKFYGKYIFFYLVDNSFYKYALFLDSGGNLYLKKVRQLDDRTYIIVDINIDDIPISILYELLLNIRKIMLDFRNEEDNYKQKIFLLSTKLDSYLKPYIEYKIWVESILEGKITNSGKKKITVKTRINNTKQQVNIDYEGIFSFDFIKKYMEINNSISKEKKEEWLEHILKNKKIKKKNGTKFSFMPRINSIANSIKKYNAKKTFTNNQIQEILVT